MSYSIVRETKIVTLQDGRILHLSLQGCNNDDAGRKRDEFDGKIYTAEEFDKHIHSFATGGKSYKDGGEFELKIGSRCSSFFDYSNHLLRMRKRACTWQFLRKERFAYAMAYVEKNGKPFIKVLYSEEEIISAMDNNTPVQFYVA